MTEKDVSLELFDLLKADPAYNTQIDEILEREAHSIGPDFLGFMKAYKLLSDLIPKGRVIYDFGCSSAIQAWYFREHRQYIGIDLLAKTDERLKTPNSLHFQMTIREYLRTFPLDDQHFAICNYVPPWHDNNEELVRRATSHCYVYYPMRGDRPDIKVKV